MNHLMIDAAVYLALSAVSFGIAVALWRRIFADFRNWIDRFLFSGTVVGVAIMLAGWYHALTGDRPFGMALMMLALVEATVVMVTCNLFAARAYRTPYDPEKDPEFMAEVAARRQRIEACRRQLAAHDDRRLLP